MKLRRLKDYREDFDYTQKYVAQYLGITRDAYAKYEIGQNNISIQSLVKLSSLYQLSLDYLTERSTVQSLNKNMTFNIECLQERLILLRKENKLNQKFIANLIDVKNTQYSNYENGKTIIPLEKLIVLADYYNVSLDYLTGKTDDRNIKLK